jgi:uncharacterized protein YceK
MLPNRLNGIRLGQLVAVLIACHGCGTIGTLTEHEPRNKVYSGVAADFSSSWTFGHVGILDWPFSLAADTLMLPYTIPKTIINYCQKDSEWEPKK